MRLIQQRIFNVPGAFDSPKQRGFLFLTFLRIQLTLAYDENEKIILLTNKQRLLMVPRLALDLFMLHISEAGFISLITV